MNTQAAAIALLAQEARALLTRVGRLAPFAMRATMVPAAAVSPAAQTGVETLLLRGKRQLSRMVRKYLRWLRVTAPTAALAQRRFNVLRLRFNGVIRQFDVFAAVLTQRSEHETGIWVAGLDDVAEDALRLPSQPFKAPPVMCYVDRNHGAAIRRAYTRLPGGGINPVAVISVPRERMIGSGIASSLVHETGHQGAALLKLVPSVRGALREKQRTDPRNAEAWGWFDKWISEILADLWSVARIGIGSTQGLIAVVSLPRPMVFRLDAVDPHPIPWLRVKISCAIGNRFYPHPQWSQLAQVWQTLYPVAGLERNVASVIEKCERVLPAFANLLFTHQPVTLRGKRVGEVLTTQGMRPEQLRAAFRAWRARPDLVRTVNPCYVFAAIGQARADGQITPEVESQALSRMLNYWALRSALDTSAGCVPSLGAPSQSRYATLI